MLRPEDKEEIERPSTPRPEIDILAYTPCGNMDMKPPPHRSLLVEQNTLLWVECKSFLDSKGVAFWGNVKDASNRGASRFKIFTDERYRRVVSNRLLNQVVQEGLTLPQPTLRYCLFAGHTYPKTRNQLREHFQQQRWILCDEEAIREQVGALATQPYENDVAMIVAKLFEKTKVK
jgi:hypothetical protein